MASRCAAWSYYRTLVNWHFITQESMERRKSYVMYAYNRQEDLHGRRIL